MFTPVRYFFAFFCRRSTCVYSNNHLPSHSEREDLLRLTLSKILFSDCFFGQIFIFIGTGSVVATQEALGESTIQIPSLTAIALAHGFCIMIMVYSIGEVSGGNPCCYYTTNVLLFIIPTIENPHLRLFAS